MEEEVRTREREEMRVVSDQALRASLNTLLSCAAAARKANDPAVGAMAQVRERESPLERSVERLRVVQGDGPPPPTGGAVHTPPATQAARASKAGTGTASSAGSRTSGSPANSVSGDQSKRRKKSKKRQEVDLVMVVSLAAGAVVVVAAVGFAAFMVGGWVRREIAQDSVEAVLKEEVRRRGVRT
jgi:cobalamin biosynthesis Mg chelatase CobN